MQQGLRGSCNRNGNVTAPAARKEWQEFRPSAHKVFTYHIYLQGTHLHLPTSIFCYSTYVLGGQNYWQLVADYCIGG